MMATAMDADTARLQLLPIILDMAADVVCLFRYIFDDLRNKVNNHISFCCSLGPKYSIQCR